MTSTLRIVVSTVSTLILAITVYLNYTLYYQPQFGSVGGATVNTDLLYGLRHLKKQIHAGAADEMQQLYPEGFVFLIALYGLAWTDLAGGIPRESALFGEALQETEWAVAQINSPKAKATFTAGMTPAYGAFYNGWSGYLLGKRLLLAGPTDRNGRQAAAFSATCERIAQALAQSKSPHLPSYPGAAWPADGVLCVATLALHDLIYPPKYQPVIARWLPMTRANHDSLGLIPHEVDTHEGTVLVPARGSSQSLMLAILPEIDPAYARQQFALYKTHFTDFRLGLPGIREFPNGVIGFADVDSGPVLFQIGGAASIVGRRTMQQYGETTLAVGLRNSIEAFGIPWTRNGQKAYLWGALPIADAFIAWSNGLEGSAPMATQTSWRSKFQLISLLVASAGLLGLGWILRKPKQKEKGDGYEPSPG
jgi:hypothetical protein